MVVVVYLMICCHGDCREGVVSLTHEQSRIVNHPIKPGDVVKVVAFAGQWKVLVHMHTLHSKNKCL